MSTIFTKIIAGEIPCHKVHEDDKILVFMDILPVQPGMVLVVPKAEVDNFEDLSDEDYQALWATVKKVAKKMRQVFPAKKKIAVQVEGLDVAHVHVKMFPIDSGAEFHAKPNLGNESDHALLTEMATKLAF